MTSILSFDPAGKGGDTGIVHLVVTDVTRPVLLNSWAVSDGFDGFCEWAYDIGSMLDPDVCIVEHFVHFTDIKIESTPMLIEGVIRYLWPNTILSPASGKNTSVPDDVLKKLGMYFPGDHHRDRTEAARHAIRYLKQQKHIPTLRTFSSG